MIDENKDICQIFYDIALEPLNMVRGEFIAQFGEERVDVVESDDFSSLEHFIKYFFMGEYTVTISNLRLPASVQAALEPDYSIFDGLDTLYGDYKSLPLESQKTHPLALIAEAIITDEEVKRRYQKVIGNFNLFQVMVWWPTVKITNEHNDSTDIKDLYAKIKVWYSGRLDDAFQLNRATYTLPHWINNYMHSHVSDIPKDCVHEFQYCCLGSGPIRHTIGLLQDDDIFYTQSTNWQLFCWELDKYVHVESLDGTPYHRLKESSVIGGIPLMDNTWALSLINRNRMSSQYGNQRIQSIDLDKLIKYVVRHADFKYAFKNGQYVFAHSNCELALIIGKAILEFIKEDEEGLIIHDIGRDTLFKGEALFNRMLMYNILYKGIYANNLILNSHAVPTEEDLNEDEGSLMFTFKGSDVHLHIEHYENPSNGLDKFVYVPNLAFMEYICGQILIFINSTFLIDGPTYNTPIK